MIVLVDIAIGILILAVALLIFTTGLKMLKNVLAKPSDENKSKELDK